MKLNNNIAQKTLPLSRGVRGVYVLVLFTALFNSCGKNKPNYPINNDLKAAFDYLPGTYWVYKDSISGRIDSFYVDNNSINRFDQGDHTMDDIAIGIFEKNINNFPVNSSSSAWEWDLIGNFVRASYDPSNSSNISYSYSPLFTYPLQVGTFIKNDGSTTLNIAYLTQIISSFVINSQNFSNVAEINQKELISSTIGYTNDWFYVSIDVGIIKMRLYHPQDSTINKVWELQRWNIVK